MAGGIKGITIEFRGDVTPLQTALRTVNDEIGKTDKELKEVRRALKFNPTSVDLWRQKQELLTQKIASTEDKLSALKQQQKQMDDDGVDKNSEAYRKLQREIIETESKLKTFKGQLREIGNVNLRAVGEQLKGIGSKMTAVGKNMSMYVTAPLVAVGASAAKNFAEVDKTMQLTNATMGTTKEQAELLDQAMKDAAANSTYGMQEAATATLNFARAGLTAEQAAAALAPAMNLAAGEGGDLDTVSAGLVATINGFHGSFDDAAMYADVFANACNNSALDVDSLSNAMSVAAPVFSAAGYSINDAALYMGVMANNGIEADKAANSLKTGMARLLDPAKQGAEMMDQLGISIVNSDGTMKDSVQVQQELHDAFSGLSEAEQVAAASAIFGKNQMSPWLALINTAPGNVGALNTKLMETGTTTQMASAMMSGFGGSMEKLKSSVDVASASLGEALAPVILIVAEGIQKLVDWFNGLSPTMQTVIATILMVVAALGPLLAIGGLLLSGIGNLMIMGPMVMSMLAAIGPIILIVVGVIAALIVVGVLLYKNWDKIKATASRVWKGIKSTIKGAIDGAKAAVTAGVEKIKSAWDKITSIPAKVKATFEKVKAAIKEKIDAAKDAVKGAIDKIKSFFPLKFGKIFSGLKLPHFSVSGGKFPYGVGGKGTVPKWDVSWYAKGGIFDAPSVIGVGEAGSEAVVPLDPFWSKMDKFGEQISKHAGNTVNVYVTVNGAERPEDYANRLARQLKMKMRTV